MPQEFKALFPSTKVVIDGTEIPIQKPSNIQEQSATWSSYKNRNTLKCLIGISPRGCVTFVSAAYGGSASDRQIFERSDLMQNKHLLQKGDSVMADRGFIVQDLLAIRDVAVNTPSMLRGVTQLPAKTVVKDRRIANKRVHVERLIGFAKTFKILKDELHQAYVPLGGRILFVCFVISNFRQSIVSQF
jgi:DDE superfamily endonuclease